MNKKLLYALFTGILATGVLTACGDGEQDPATEEGQEVEEEGMEEAEAGEDVEAEEDGMEEEQEDGEE